jgi:iron(III) transport system ATP-binding protein
VIHDQRVAAWEHPAIVPVETLRCEGLSKQFSGTPVVRDVSVSVCQGEILSLLGPSGCGKTTTLRLIAGLEHLDRGSIEIAGQCVAHDSRHLSPERRRVGLVFQDYALFPHLTVAGNVGFGLGRGRGSRQEVEDLLATVGLAGLAHRMPHELSGGQQQRVALARALAIQPRLMLLDEPFSNLDPDLRSGIRREVAAILRRSGTTAVLVTHDQDEALSISDRVAVMLDGEIAQVGSPEDVYANPSTRAVASFVGEAAFVAGHARGTWVETGFGPIELVRETHGPVDVLVRPEMVDLHPSGPELPISGMVVEREYLGRHQTIVVATPREGRLVATVGSRMRYDSGDQVGISIRGPVVAFPVGVDVA